MKARHAAEQDQDYATGVLTASEEQYDAYVAGNLAYAYDAGDWGRIRIGANNVTDEDSVLNPIWDGPATITLYDYVGRVVFVEYSKTFDW